MPRNQQVKQSAELKASMDRLAAARKKTSRSGPAKQFKSWSFTKYNDFKQCPLKAKLKYLDKVEEPPNDAMARGSDIGKVAEAYIKGTIGAKMPPELAHFADEFKRFRKLYAKDKSKLVVEDQWSLTKDWKLTKWDDWDGCALRLKVDAAELLDGGETMDVIDWKTGKYRIERREEYVEQLELYVTGAFIAYPKLKTVRARLCYLDVGVQFPTPGDIEGMTFTRDDLPQLKKLWDKRTRSMLLSTSFPPRPNDKCRWCHYRKENTTNLPGKKQLCKF